MTSITMTSSFSTPPPTMHLSPPIPSKSSNPPNPSSAPEPPESFVTRYFTTPLFFASFLLSFLLVDNRNHSHATSSRKHESSGAEPWFWRAKHRKLARLEIGEALEMRRLVVLGMLLGLAFGCVGAWWGVRSVGGVLCGLLWRV